MWTYNQTNELCHFGVKGMKWGVRRAAQNRTKEKRKGTLAVTKSHSNDDNKKQKKQKMEKAIAIGRVVGLVTAGVAVAKLTHDINKLEKGRQAIQASIKKLDAERFEMAQDYISWLQKH